MGNYQEKGISTAIENIVALEDTESKQISGVYRERRQFGDSGAAHLFDVGGKIQGVWASSDLDQKLQGEEGNNVRITYLETQELKGGRTFKMFKVEVEQKI